MKPSLLFALALAATPTGLQANTALDNLRELVIACEEAKADGNTSAATVAAAGIVRLEGPFFNTAMETRAESCLNEFAGDGWEYSFQHKKFVSATLVEAEELLAETRKAIEKKENELAREIVDAMDEHSNLSELAAERLREADVRHVVARTIIACTALFQRDEIAALTNPVCNEAFLASGLPEE